MYKNKQRENLESKPSSCIISEVDTKYLSTRSWCFLTIFFTKKGQKFFDITFCLDTRNVFYKVWVAAASSLIPNKLGEMSIPYTSEVGIYATKLGELDNYKIKMVSFVIILVEDYRLCQIRDTILKMRQKKPCKFFLQFLIKDDMEPKSEKFWLMKRSLSIYLNVKLNDLASLLFTFDKICRIFGQSYNFVAYPTISLLKSIVDDFFWAIFDFTIRNDGIQGWKIESFDE